MEIAGSLVDVSDEELSFTIGANAYKVRRLRLGDYAAAQQYKRSQRIGAVLQAFQGVPVDDKVVSGAVAEVAAGPVSIRDLLDDYESELFLLGRIITADGKPIKSEILKDGLPAFDRRVMSALLVWAYGLPLPEGEARPLDLTAIASS